MGKTEPSVRSQAAREPSVSASTAPELSVIVPSVNGYEALEECLSALDQQEGVAVEIVVVDRLGEPVREAVRRDFPGARLVQMPSATGIPHMRAAGFTESAAPAVAVIEDHVIVPPTWARQMLDALAAGEDVVGGSIENAATDRLVDWASFLCEYSGCLTPLPAGESTWLPGNNVVYRRQLLDRFRSVIAEGDWENRLHDAMRAEGIRLIMRPDIAVGHKMHYTFRLYLSQRFLYARSYAGARVRGSPMVRRLAYGAAAFGLPPLLLYRTVARTLAKGKHVSHLVKSLPLLTVFVVSWSLGEVVGSWFGAGNALHKVR